MLRVRSAAAVEPRTLDLGQGASITFKPADFIMFEAASAGVAVMTRKLLEGSEALDDLGIEVPAAIADDEMRSGLGSYLMAVELGVQCITSWQGIGDAEGKPLDVSRRAIGMLFRETSIARAFGREAMRGIHEVYAEGNGFAGSPNGAGTPADDIAPDAGTSARDAPPAAGTVAENAAPSRKTRR